MERKAKIQIYIAMFGCLLIAVLLIFAVKKRNEKEEIEPLYGEEEISNIDEEETWPESTGGEYEWDDGEIHEICLMSNERYLAENGLTRYGISSLSEYLYRYLSYYKGPGTYEATILDGTYHDSQTNPNFKVKLSTGEEIACYYSKASERYIFKCDVIEHLRIEKEETAVDK